MNIPVNKDIEEEYKDEFIKGFTLRECVYVAAALMTVALAGGFCWWKLGLAVNVSVYVGFPFAVPILLLGFLKPSGMPAGKYLKEIHWEKKTKLLLYDAGEKPETDETFSMQTNGSLTEEKWKGRKKEDRKNASQRF